MFRTKQLLLKDSAAVDGFFIVVDANQMLTSLFIAASLMHFDFMWSVLVIVDGVVDAKLN